MLCGLGCDAPGPIAGIRMKDGSTGSPTLLPRLARLALRLWGRGHLIPFVESLSALGRPARVAFPPELIEQGVALALSGIGNTAAIQSNPDWVWPRWVERQIDPDAAEFIPTGLNVLTTNVTGRNWTSIGLDGSPREAMVDPVGMLTPHPWGWSVLPWLRLADRMRIPSRMDGICQHADSGAWASVRSSWTENDVTWSWTWEAVELEGEEGILHVQSIQNGSTEIVEAELGLALRPCNTLSIGHINSLSLHDRVWKVNGKAALLLFATPTSSLVSDRHHGDPLDSRPSGLPIPRLRSRSGIATGVSSWDVHLAPGERKSIEAFVPLAAGSGTSSKLRRILSRSVDHARERMVESYRVESREGARVEVPDPRLQEAFDAVRSRLHVFDDGDRYSPGTFLYHHHWFRDAAFLSLGFENMGLGRRTVQKLEMYPKRQARDGLFRSQTGEWDSNGQALWTLGLHVRRGGDPAIADRLWRNVVRGVEWMDKIRQSASDAHVPHRGLMPAGFSAEHFGPNDHYLWDNFWSVAGMREACDLASLVGRKSDADRFQTMLEEYRADLAAGMRWGMERAKGALPCSPYRRLDAAAVGNLVAVSPLGVAAASDSWVGPTLDYLLSHCFRQGLFFQSIVHTGLNPYLSIQVARVLQARGDARVHVILQALLDKASSTWCWPEAIHPVTGGGCMGDGDHGWAAAEFLSLVRDLFVREAPEGLLLFDGAPVSWFRSGRPFSIANAPTDHGSIDLVAWPEDDLVHIDWRRRRASHQKDAPLRLSLPNNAGGRDFRLLEGESGSTLVHLKDLPKDALP